MRIRTLALALLLFAAACSKITQENFSRIQDGMSEQEVQALLGSPTESSSKTLLGITGTSSKWVASDALITVQFVNGKVLLKSFDKPPVK